MGEHLDRAIALLDEIDGMAFGKVSAALDTLQSNLMQAKAETEKSRATIEALVGALEACEEYFDNRSDVKDGDYGIPEPNREMVLLSEVRAALQGAR